jgi:YOP proteins translocation protein K (YscK)
MHTEPRLQTLIADFNLRPAGYVDSSWLPADWPAALGQPDSLQPLSRDVLSNWLLQRHGLTQQFCFDFSQPERRYALLTRAAFQGLALYLGLVVCRDRVRTVIDKATVARLIDNLGSRAYEFAVFKAPATPLRAYAVAFEPGRVPLPRQLLSQGARVLLALFEPAWRAIGGRVRLKLPREVAEAAPLALSRSEQRSAREVLAARVIPEGFAQWAWLF